MADSKISNLNELATAPDAGDLFVIVDVSDTSMSASGTTKKIQSSNAVPDSSTTVKGKVELATDAETITGSDTVRAVTPSNITAKMDTDGTLAGNLDTRIPSQKAVKTYGDRALNTTLTIHPLYAPEGFLINGKIEVTDASGITVALKTLAGATPSATDPIYIRIGNTVRTITSATTAILADGTNWFNAGSAELATKEIDYFAYAVYDSNSSVVALTFARIPSANLVSDFSATTTNEKHCANYANFTSTDEVEVIGRFAATLSAGAGYTWSVPTYTAANLIQRPIYETRWLTSVPTYNNSIGNGTNTLTYKVVGNIVQCRQEFSVGSSTTTGTVLNWVMPFGIGGTANSYLKGSCKMLDNGTRYYLGVASVVSATTFSWVHQNDAGQGQLAATSGPMTWATGDTLSGWFEMAI